MKTVWIFGLSMTLAAASSAAIAFDEQRQGAAVPGAPAAAAPQKSAPAPKAGAAPNLNLEAPEPSKLNEDTVVRIPGIGKLGVLPKLDFGLELLYGANSDKQPDGAQPQEADPNDLTIRGSLKHKF